MDKVRELAPRIPIDAEAIDHAFAKWREQIEIETVTAPKRRKWPWLAAAAATVAVLSLVLVILPAPDAMALFPGYSPTPIAESGLSNSVDPTHIKDIAESNLDHYVELRSMDNPAFAALEPALSEFRGDNYYLTVRANSEAMVVSFLAWPDAEPGGGTLSGDELPGVAQDGINIFSGTMAGEDRGPFGFLRWTDAYSIAYGQAGADVKTVTITLVGGERIEATVSGGVWAAWWPGNYAGRIQYENYADFAIEWTLTDDGVVGPIDPDDVALPTRPRT